MKTTLNRGMIGLTLLITWTSSSLAVNEDLQPPCWRNQAGTTRQTWGFNTGANPAWPSVTNNAAGSPQATLSPNFNGNGWTDTSCIELSIGCAPDPDPFGTSQGRWDLGGTNASALLPGSVLLTIPNIASASATRYLWVQATVWIESGIAALPTYVVSNAVQIGSAVDVSVEAGPVGGEWRNQQTLWSVPATGTSNNIVIHSAGIGTIIESVVVDTMQRAPAGNDTASTPQNTATNLAAAALLANDGGPTLSVIGVSTPSAQNGTVSLAAGVVTYTPQTGFTGSDSFYYTNSDCAGVTAVGSVLIQVGTVCPAIALSPASPLPGGQQGSNYSQTISASGGTPSYTFALTSGSLPGGLSLLPGGLLSGIPTTVQSSSFTVQATDAGGCTNSKAYTLAILPANLGSNQVIAAAGNYYGLFTDESTPIVSFERSGLFTLKLDTKQKFSAKAYIDGKSVGLSGTMNVAGYGVSTKPATRKGKASLWMTVQMAFDGSESVTGTLYTMTNAPTPGGYYGGTFTSVLTGFKAINMTNNVATNMVGTYTLVVDVPTNTLAPRGNGYGTITMGIDGKVKLTGKMGDYARFKTVTVPISKDGDWPLYASTYKGIVNYLDKDAVAKVNKENSGMIMGWMKFTNHTGLPAGRDLLDDGTVSWVKLPNTNNFYVDGFTNHYTPVLGSIYTAPLDPKTTRILSSFDGTLGFGTVASWEGDLLTPFTNSIFMATNNKVSIIGLNQNTNKVSIAYKTGLIKNDFSHPGDPVATKKKGYGVVLQDDQVGYGVFKGTNDSGSFRLISN